MGLGRKVINSIAKHPGLNGKIAAAAEFLRQMPELEEILRESYFQDTGMLTTVTRMLAHSVPTALSAFVAVYFSSIVLHQLTKRERSLRLGDYKLIKQLKEQLNQQTPPTMQFSGTQNVDCSVFDFLKSKYVSASRLEKNAREKKDYVGAMNTIFRYFRRVEDIDKGLILLRDAQEWIERKKPKLNLKTRTLLPIFSFAVRGGRILDPLEVEVYMASAANESISNPEKAWYWSALGKKVADTLDMKKAEMYVFHALLATAQKRSDEKQAWEDAFLAMRQRCKPERLGESRNPTWKLKDEKQFFSGTFVFKGNHDREELRKEWKHTEELEQKLEQNAVVPQRLHITPKPYDDYYVYIMRYLKGETLDEQLKKGDKSGLEKVEKVLARILVQCQTDGLPKIPVKEKTGKKLASLGLGNMIKYFEQAMTHLERQPLWVVNKDGHPQQWQMLDEKYAPAQVGVLDMEKMGETHLLTNESANLYECNKLTNEERQKALARFATNIRQEGRRVQKNEFAHAYEDNYSGLLIAHNLSTLHRVICLETAWAEPDRNKTPEERLQVIENGLRATDALKKEGYYKNDEDYEGQRKTFEKIRELIPT